MRIKTEGIFLGKVRFGDTGQILKIFTRDAGLRGFVSKSNRNKNSALSACHFPLAPLALSFDLRENRDLQFLSELSLLRPLPGIYDDPMRASVATFLAELLTRALEEHYVNEALFDLVLNSAERLSSENQFSSLHLETMMGMADCLGFAPDVSGIDDGFDLSEGVRCRNTEERKYVLSGPIAASFIRLAGKKEPVFSKQERTLLTEIMLDYFKLHLPHMRPVRSLEVIKAVFS